MKTKFAIGIKVKKFVKPEDNEANQKNPNLGTSGTNRQYDKVHGNRSQQLSPENEKGSDNTLAPHSSDSDEVREKKAHLLLVIDPSLAFEIYPELKSQFNEDEWFDE